MNKVKIVYEDEYLMVVDKPAGLLVHETAAHESETLTNDIVRHIKGLKKLDWPDPLRPGIVHRLDKNTSGLIFIAKTPEILTELQQQFKDRQVEKEYTALVYGLPSPKQGSIEAAIGRHPTLDKQTIIPMTFAWTKGKIRPAVTQYKIIDEYQYQKQTLALIIAKPLTGRMHQIRVHLKYLGYPIIGDPIYFTKPSKRLSKNLGLDRQFLHASKLIFTHPISQQPLEFQSSLPKELTSILNKFERRS